MNIIKAKTWTPFSALLLAQVLGNTPSSLIACNTLGLDNIDTFIYPKTDITNTALNRKEPAFPKSD